MEQYTIGTNERNAQWKNKHYNDSDGIVHNKTQQHNDNKQEIMRGSNKLIKFTLNLIELGKLFSYNQISEWKKYYKQAQRNAPVALRCTSFSISFIFVFKAPHKSIHLVLENFNVCSEHYLSDVICHILENVTLQISVGLFLLKTYHGISARESDRHAADISTFLDIIIKIVI